MFKFPNGSCSTTLSGMFCDKLFIFFLVNESLFFFVSACSKLLWIHFIFLCLILSGNSSFIESYYLGASVFVTVVWKWLKSDFFSCNSYSAICPCKKKPKYHSKISVSKDFESCTRTLEIRSLKEHWNTCIWLNFWT